MLRLVPNFISTLLKGSSRPPRNRSHLMLAGINQSLFINQWGHPEIKISLDRLQGYYESGLVSFYSSSNEESFHTVWIYEKKDRIFFFHKGNLVSHFKWSEFRGRWKKSEEVMNFRTSRNSASLFATTVSVMA